MVGRKWGQESPEEWLRGPEPMSWRRVYPGRCDQAAAARTFAAALFAGSGREDEVEFVVAEFVADALLYTRSGGQGGWFGLELAVTELAYVAVTDLGGGGMPTVLPEAPREPGRARARPAWGVRTGRRTWDPRKPSYRPHRLG